jgi:glucokinase
MALDRTVGLDLGGTKLASGVVDPEGSVIWSDQVSSKGYSQEAVIDLLADGIERARSEAPDADHIGVGIPATIDFARGRAISTVNLGLEDLPVRDLLEERTGATVWLDNDGNLAMLAEAVHGAAKGARDAITLTIGTGIGGGIWLDGRIYRGSTGAGAELGHMVVDFDGPPCQGNCPGRGCVETLASGTAIAREGSEAALANPDSVLGEMIGKSGELTAEQVHRAAVEGDEVAIGVIETAGRYLGAALVSLVNLFEPEVVVVGGGAMAMGELLLGPARQEVRDRALKPMRETPVVPAVLGPDAGMIGAATLARIEAEGRD